MASIKPNAVAMVDATQVLSVLNWLLHEYTERDPLRHFELPTEWYLSFQRVSCWSLT